MNDMTIEPGTALTAPFIRQMVVQLRAMDSYGTYDNWSDEKVLDPMILTKERRREIPVIGDPDEVVVARIKAYYNAIAVRVEQESGLMAVPMINLSHEGFGRALVMVGKLVVIDKSLRDVHRFGFDTVEKLDTEAEKLVARALTTIEKYRAAAED
ncbi:NifX-associated protein [Marinobacterium lacunae]|uniref:NifX-associated protein n=1 Tax=Marinobacterium lacunae TaxID=1232683 RepID=A0A081FVP1_9GAMM|nr:NifX-associated nitrogen fixation protein [Marinobacterium lacunae]KEA62596.1 NifX-associated protein [Marinobacterium lacunae]MBR9882897.1 NifX-associated nitrogen fixation protein [Oceanospirillales bacterium]